MEDFGALNWTILSLFIVSNLVLGFVISKKVDSAKDFYTGRKNTPWWAIGISVVATYVSAITFLGAPAWAYKEGLSVIAIHLNYPIVIVLVITFFLPFFFNSGVVSIYDYQEKRFGVTSRAVIALIFLITQALSSAAILYGTSLVISFITGIDVITCIFIVTLIALLYTSMGGITAVIWTDVIQAGILLMGGVIITYELAHSMPDSLSVTLSQLKVSGKLNPIRWTTDLSYTTSIWAGIIAMSVYHVTVYGANQMMVQRTLAAKNIGDAKKSFLLMGFAAFFIYFLFIFLGVLFYAYYKGKTFDNDNMIILNFAKNLAIPGLMGLIASAVVAASMSTLDSAFNSMSTISTVGFYEKYFNKGKSPRHYLKATRWFTVMWAVLIIIPAIVYAKSADGSVLELLSKVGSYFVGAKLSMYGLGFFSKHTSERGLLVGVVAGFIGLFLIAYFTSISWPWYCLIGASINIVVSIPMSLLLDGRQSEWSPYSIKGQKLYFAKNKLSEHENGWYKLPGKMDKVSYLLLGFFIVTFIFLLLFEKMV